jgi:HEXXH motif-containing protein
VTDTVSYAKVFASPAGGDAAAIVRSLALGRWNSTRRRVAGALADSGEPKAAEALLAFSTGKGSAWRPETGLALMAHRERSHGLAALQLAAAAAGMGGSGAVETRLASPGWLYLDGWLTPVAGSCALSADGGSVRIDSGLGSAAYVAQGRGWQPSGAPTGPWTAYPTGGLAPRYVTASGLRHSVEGFPWIAQTPPVERPTNATADPRIATIHQGWQVILDRTPVYGSWVAGTAAGCLLLDPSGSHAAQSGSSFDHPGLIAIEPPACPVFCGELLVHECSHQHMLVYMMIAPLVAAGSTESFFSPIKRATRTVDRVLSGAHAVGNMVIYYATLRRTAPLDPSSQERFDLHRTWFAEDYRPSLNRSETLTEAGRALWNHLCEAVNTALEQ